MKRKPKDLLFEIKQAEKQLLKQQLMRTVYGCHGLMEVPNHDLADRFETWLQASELVDQRFAELTMPSEIGD